MATTVNHVANCTYVLAVSNPAIKFVRSEIDKQPIQKAEMEQYWKVSENPVLNHNTMAEDELLLPKMISLESSSLSTGKYNDEKKQSEGIQYIYVFVWAGHWPS